MSEISILIVGYNSADLIGDCLRAIPEACTKSTYEILLIDNGDGTTESLVKRDFPMVRIVKSEGNIGFAAGNNRLAVQASGEFLLLLNPDMVPDPGSIDALMNGTQRHRHSSAWGAITLGPDGEPDSANAIAIPSLAEFMSLTLGRSREGTRGMRRLNQDQRRPTLSGSFVMIARSAWEAVEGMDERYFLYCEEVDLFYRLGRKGHDFWRVADARGRHLAGHGKGSSPVRMLYKAAGTVQFLRLHWSAPARGLGIALMWIAAIERYLAGKLLGRWKPRLRKMGEAYRLIARRPRLWIAGYDTKRGLLERLREVGELR